jgi:hypothetical protein
VARRRRRGTRVAHRLQRHEQRRERHGVHVPRPRTDPESDDVRSGTRPQRAQRTALECRAAALGSRARWLDGAWPRRHALRAGLLAAACEPALPVRGHGPGPAHAARGPGLAFLPYQHRERVRIRAGYDRRGRRSLRRRPHRVHARHALRPHLTGLYDVERPGDALLPRARQPTLRVHGLRPVDVVARRLPGSLARPAGSAPAPVVRLTRVHGTTRRAAVQMRR